MPSTSKLLILLALIFGIPIYLVYIVKEGLEFQIAGGILLLALTSLLIFTGRPSIVKVTSKEINTSLETSMHEGIVDLPPPVLELEGPSHRRDEKVRRSRGGSKVDLSEIVLPDVIDSDAPSLASVEEINNTDQPRIAMTYVATSDPQSQMESEIDIFVEEKRIKREELKRKITIERRIKTSKRKTSKAVNWAEIEDGEDISGLLKDPNHGLTVLSESEEVDSSAPYGISYVRIDNQRILKVRMPLNVDKSSKIKDANSIPSLPESPGLPPLPEPPELPSMPTPPPIKYVKD
jgi:hypothetical protein|tara:strand:- start:401 stop:1276 length:876 start_codon:yes stop_codon:yes gene_type:complete